MKNLVLLFICCILPQTLFARPDIVEVWFLTAPSHAFLKELKDPAMVQFFSKKIVARTDECIVMGDGCFHPQFGFLEGDAMKEVKEDSMRKNKFEGIHSEGTGIIDCKKGDFFDIFCGKSKKRGASFNFSKKMELWVDTSSSFRAIDYSKEANFCGRQKLIKKLREGCKNLSVSIYNISKKELGRSSGACTSHGTNDTKRLVQWIESSSAKQLIIITDTNEMSSKLSAYLMSIDADIKGLGVKPLTAASMYNQADRLLKICQKL